MDVVCKKVYMTMIQSPPCQGRGETPVASQMFVNLIIMKAKILKVKNKGRKMKNGYYLYLISILLEIPGALGLMQDTVGLTTSKKVLKVGAVQELEGFDADVRVSNWVNAKGEACTSQWIKFTKER